MEAKEKLRIKGDLIRISLSIKENLMIYISLKRQLNELRSKCSHDDISENNYTSPPTCLICGNVFEFSHYCLKTKNKICVPESEECRQCEIRQRLSSEVKGY